MSTYESLTLHPAKSLQDKRLRRLNHICQELKRYHPAKAAKRNLIKRLLWDYESLLENIQSKLEGA